MFKIEIIHIFFVRDVLFKLLSSPLKKKVHQDKRRSDVVSAGWISFTDLFSYWVPSRISLQHSGSPRGCARVFVQTLYKPFQLVSVFPQSEMTLTEWKKLNNEFSYSCCCCIQVEKKLRWSHEERISKIKKDTSIPLCGVKDTF